MAQCFAFFQINAEVVNVAGPAQIIYMLQYENNITWNHQLENIPLLTYSVLKNRDEEFLRNLLRNSRVTQSFW